MLGRGTKPQHGFLKFFQEYPVMTQSVSSPSRFRPPSPTNKANEPTPLTKELFETQKEARLQVGRWAESALHFKDPMSKNPPSAAHYSAYAGVVFQTVIPQIVTGKMTVDVDAPGNPNDRAFLNTLHLPAGYTLNIIESESQAAQLPEPPEEAADTPASLDPFSAERAYVLPGGRVEMPSSLMTVLDKKNMGVLARNFARTVEAAKPEDRSVLATLFLEQVNKRADRAGSERGPFQLEVAIELREWAGAKKNDLPLRLLLQKLPDARWLETFEPRPESKNEFQDDRPAVASNAKPAVQARASIVRSEPPVVPTLLATAVNEFVINFDEVDATANKDTVNKIVELIGKATDGSPNATMAMTAAVADQLRRACSRKEDPRLLCFASNLPPHSQAVFMDLWMSDELFPKAQGFVRKLASDRVEMSDAQFSKFQVKFLGVVKVINKLPYPTRMMVTNDLNNELERIASANKVLGPAIREFKIQFEDLD